MTLRRARPDEARALTELAVRSKRTWGYDDEFMAKIAGDMLVHEEDLRDGYGVVAQRRRVIIGYGLLLQKGDAARICDVFVAPEHLREGIGKAIVLDLLDRAREWKTHFVELVSDPHAVGFYRRFGFRSNGWYESPHLPGRRLPVMHLPLIR